jgi:predicted  nucleic acid-binding Zn-ribbon protein
VRTTESRKAEDRSAVRSARTWRPRVSPDEAEMLAKLRALYEEYQQLNRRITVAAQKRRFSNDPAEAARAAREEQAWLKDISRLMDRMRAAESSLMRARNAIRPLYH